MIYIAIEDTQKIANQLVAPLCQLGNGATRYEANITVGDDLPVGKVVAYWVGDVLRIDLKFKVKQ